MSQPIYPSRFRLNHSWVSVWIQVKHKFKRQHRKMHLSAQSVLQQCHTTVHWNTSLLLEIESRQLWKQDLQLMWQTFDFFVCRKSSMVTLRTKKETFNSLCVQYQYSHEQISFEAPMVETGLFCTTGFPLLLIIYPPWGLNKPSFFTFLSIPPLTRSPQKPQT